MTISRTAIATHLRLEAGVEPVNVEPTVGGYAVEVRTRRDALRAVVAIASAWASDPELATMLDAIELEEVTGLGEARMRVAVTYHRLTANV